MINAPTAINATNIAHSTRSFVFICFKIIDVYKRQDTSCSIHMERVLKNNGVVLDSLALLRLEKHCSPVISLEMLYEQFEKGRTLAELCEYMISITDAQLPVSVTSLTSLSSFEEFRDQITRCV